MRFTDSRELGPHVIGSNDVALGVVDGIYTDIQSGYPQWAAIQSGLFGADVSIIPLYVTEPENLSLRIPSSIQNSGTRRTGRPAPR